MFTAGPHPLHVDIDLSTKCNLRCRFCHLSHFEPKEWTQISLEQFAELEPVLSRAKSITLFSKYEPLTCRDFVPIFERIATFGAETYFSTNGILLTDEVIDALVGRLTFLTVSVTGFERETYARHMGQDRLDTVRDNLARLNAAKAARGTDLPKLRVSTVGMQETVDDLTMAVDFARDFAMAEGVQVTYLKAHGPEMVADMPLADPARFAASAAKAAEYAASLGIKFDLQGGTIDEIEAATAALGHKMCDMPWRRLSLQPNGDVYPCPLSYQPVGNFFEERLEDIWTGPRLAAFRAGVNDPENMNPDCRDCSHCRHRSVLKPQANDFSTAETYVGGMRRK